jgi:hypothetical protein
MVLADTVGSRENTQRWQCRNQYPNKQTARSVCDDPEAILKEHEMKRESCGVRQLRPNKFWLGKVRYGQSGHQNDENLQGRHCQLVWLRKLRLAAYNLEQPCGDRR